MEIHDDKIFVIDILGIILIAYITEKCLKEKEIRYIYENVISLK